MKHEIKKSDNLDIQEIQKIFEDEFGEKYKVYKPKGMIGKNFFVVAKSGWTGATVKFKKKNNYAQLITFGMFPGVFQRVLGMGLIPILIMQATSWKKLLQEIDGFIEKSEKLK